jgi:hypothetical protein
MNTHRLVTKVVGFLVFSVVFSGASLLAHAQFTSAIGGSVTDPHRCSCSQRDCDAR